MRAWTEACVAQTGSQNMFTTKRGKYFWEVSRTEHYDGAITGTIMKVTREEPDSCKMWCKPSGSFRIEADGTVTRAPKFLKDASKNAKPVASVMVGSGGAA